ncbi:MAG: hypothetical protein H7242_06640 [Microbacteriaceae bacterium]|nr:hypothetical protein [Burkholderiaceae bacterium]
MHTTRIVGGGVGRRRGKHTGQAGWQRQHGAAVTVAVTAIEIQGARRVVARGLRIDNRFDSDRGIGVLRVRVVTKMSGVGLRLMPAVRRHGRPAELERQQGEQDNGDEATHGQESSGYRVCRAINTATGR